MQGVEEKVRFCIQCGQQIGNSKFCPYCGTPVEQKAEEAVSPAGATADQAIGEAVPPIETPISQITTESIPFVEALNPPEEKPRKRKTLKIVLCCLGGLILVAALAGLVFYLMFWPGKFTGDQLQKIQSNAEERIAGILEMLGYDEAVEFDIVITDEVQKDTSWDCLERFYDIDFNLTSDGTLSERDKAAIVVLMQYQFGTSVKYDGSYENIPSTMDLFARQRIETGTKDDIIMGVSIPATNYNWTAASQFTIDGEDWHIIDDEIIKGFEPIEYTPASILTYALIQIGTNLNLSSQQDSVGSEVIPTEQLTTPSASPSSSESLAIETLEKFWLNEDRTNTITVKDLLDDMFLLPSYSAIQNEDNTIIVTVEGLYRKSPTDDYSQSGRFGFLADGKLLTLYGDLSTISVDIYQSYVAQYIGDASDDQTTAIDPIEMSTATPTSFDSPGQTLPYVIRATEEMPIYSGPGVDYDNSGSLPPGAYTIVEESGGEGADLWGKLKSGIGWIALDYVQLT